MTADQPRWLNDDELSAWLNISDLVTLLPGMLDASMQRHADMSFYEYMVLAMLSERHDHTVQLSVLAELTAGSLSRLSHVLTRLEKKGWVTRSRVPGNARLRQATLTPEGLAKVQQTAPNHVADVRALVFDHLSPEQVRQLAQLTDPIVASVRPEIGPRPAGRGRPQAEEPSGD